MENIVSNIFRKDKISFAIHGKEASFDGIQKKLEDLVDELDKSYPFDIKSS